MTATVGISARLSSQSHAIDRRFCPGADVRCGAGGCIAARSLARDASSRSMALCGSGSEAAAVPTRSPDSREPGDPATFALLWGLTVHDKEADDKAFVDGLGFIEQGATDERHFVKKAVNMALRAVGKRNAALNSAAVTVARRLADSGDETAGWVGRDALRELASPALSRRLAARPATNGR